VQDLSRHRTQSSNFLIQTICILVVAHTYLKVVDSLIMESNGSDTPGDRSSRSSSIDWSCDEVEEFGALLVSLDTWTCTGCISNVLADL